MTYDGLYDDEQALGMGPSAQGCLHAIIMLLVLGVLAGFTAIVHSAWQQTRGTTETPATPVPLSPYFTDEVLYWSGRIQHWSKIYHLDPYLVATVMQIESCGNPRAVSHAGASGLFQVMPYHFAADEDPFNPDTNARRGLTFLREMWRRADGDVAKTLAAYNGGPAQLRRAADAWPWETQRYVRWGTGIYDDARAGRTDTPTLQSWLHAGGARLCAHAREVLGLRRNPTLLPTESR
ncbi:MAG: lytic transglycosylase domain-containing protein [Chloroflexi bacterium]|nr:lytic transglycosylase domain-containing protein [Chloroflexota bacterium]